MQAEAIEADEGELSLYFATAPGTLADLEVVAAAAIQWAQGLKVAAAAVDPEYEYRVSLVAARSGSSNWIARLERSSVNKSARRIERGWKKLPLVMRLGIDLAVAIPVTIKLTYEYWTGHDGFSEAQKREMREIYEKAGSHEAVQGHGRAIYRAAQRDPKITAIGTGVPHGSDWKPASTVPANRFAEADGLFEPEQSAAGERVVPQTLDVILVTPRLENAQRAWTFRQEGLPGTFNAIMKDRRFLAALDRSGIRESLRANIPMRIRLEIRQREVDGEWRVARQGRVVSEVISPKAG